MARPARTRHHRHDAAFRLTGMVIASSALVKPQQPRPWFRDGRLMVPLVGLVIAVILTGVLIAEATTDWSVSRVTIVLLALAAVGASIWGFAGHAIEEAVVGSVNDDLLVTLAVVFSAIAGEPAAAALISAGYGILWRLRQRSWSYVFTGLAPIYDVEPPVERETLLDELRKKRTGVAKTADDSQRLVRLGALGLALLLIGFGFWVGDPQGWAQRASLLLVMSLPGVAIAFTWIPTLELIGRLCQQGILVRFQAGLPTLAKVRHVALDKTGALTTSTPELVRVIPADGQDPTRVLTLAAAIQQYASHPLGAAITEGYHRMVDTTDELPEATQVIEHPGRSVSGNVHLVEDADHPTGASSSASTRASTPRYRFTAPAPDRGVFVQIATPRWARTGQVAEDIESVHNDGLSALIVSADQEVIGVLAVRDELRPEAAEAIDQFRELGCELTVLTSENIQVATGLAENVGITDIRPQQRPEEKAVTVSALRERSVTAMIAASVTDAPALRASDVGIDVATEPLRPTAGVPASETIDMVLTTQDLRLVPTMMRQARALADTTGSLLIGLTIVAGIALLLGFTFIVPIEVPLVLWLGACTVGQWVTRHRRADSVTTQE